MNRSHRDKGWSKSAFRCLLNLYPSQFRDEYGREMMLVFADRYRDAKTIWSRFGLWLEVLTGIFIEAPKERVHMIRQDLHYALRTLRKNPLFAATIIVTLALGIGANSAIFSLLNTVVLTTLPVVNPEELFLIRVESRTPSTQRFSWHMFERLRSVMPVDGMAAMSRVARMHTQLGSAGDDEVASVQLVSGEYFSVLKVPMAVGRPLMADDNRTPGSHPVAVISHGYWQDHFGSSPDILGRELILNRVRFSIVGVAAKGFSGVWLESPAQAWIPLAMQKDVRYAQNYSASDAAAQNMPWMSQERIRWLDIVVRAAEGTAANTTLNATFQQSVSQEAETIGNADERRLFLQRRLILDPFGHGFSALRQSFSKPLYALMAMAAMVLLIACANTANLLLARATARQREIALRLSLGAGRLRLVQQLLTESLLLVVIAGAVALLIARWAGDLLIRMAIGFNSSVPFVAAVDNRVLGFTAIVALATGLMFGLAPALRSTRVELSDTLKAAARNVSGGPASHTARSLVVLQVALSLVLVAGTGLLIRSLNNLLHVNPGFDREHILSVRMNRGLTTYKQEQLPEIYRQLIERVESIPGIRSASVAVCGLVSGCRSFSDGFEIEGYQRRVGEQIPLLTNIVSPNYFSTVGMRLMEGRPFNDRDSVGTMKVAVVNEAMVRRYFANRQAIGQRFGEKTVETEIVGIVQDARVLSVKDQSVPMVFYPLQQPMVTAGSLDVRTTGDPRQAIAAVRRVMAETAPNIPVEHVTTITAQIDGSLSQERLVLSLTSAFGALALGLAGFGLFGVLSYAVARRTPEFGIKMALGAPPAKVLRDVLREAMLMALLGLAIGLTLVAAGARLVSSMLFGVSPHDWRTMLGAGIVVVASASIAGLFPALRAARVDPMIALRNE